MPPDDGPKSTRNAWRAYAHYIIPLTASIIVSKNDEIEWLKGEVALLRKQIADRKPAGARERIPDETVARIEREIADGLPTRHIGSRYGVSAMTVSRLARRMRARAKC